ncbi:hypothetical protein LX36DRAFT_364057 [Colletotrichum falcatum]|nr:hypothetical protein LX36DRAFT_364057 [Colletotrichum falcatum]
MWPSRRALGSPKGHSSPQPRVLRAMYLYTNICQQQEHHQPLSLSLLLLAQRERQADIKPSDGLRPVLRPCTITIPPPPASHDLTACQLVYTTNTQTPRCPVDPAVHPRCLFPNRWVVRLSVCLSVCMHMYCVCCNKGSLARECRRWLSSCLHVDTCNLTSPCPESSIRTLGSNPPRTIINGLGISSQSYYSSPYPYFCYLHQLPTYRMTPLSRYQWAD